MMSVFLVSCGEIFNVSFFSDTVGMKFFYILHNSDPQWSLRCHPSFGGPDQIPTL